MPPIQDDRSAFSCPLNYAIEPMAGGGVSPAPGSIEIGKGRMGLIPATGPPLLIPLEEIDAVNESNHAVRIALASGETLRLTRLGARMEDFLLNLTEARYETLLDAFWMREEPTAPPVQAELVAEHAGRPCELRLLETALVVLLPDADPVRLPYALLESARPEDHRLVLEFRWKGPWAFAGLGRAFDPFVEALSKASNALHTAHLDLVRIILPGLDAGTLRGAGTVLRDGVAVPVPALEAVGLWGPLERAAAAADAGDELSALEDLAAPPGMRAGIKRGLAGDLSGDYLFFLVPMGGDPGAVALETIPLRGKDGATGGRATYLFSTKGTADLDELNRDLLELNFRREPLLLPVEDLSRRRPIALDTLRRRLLGRVIHRTFAGWKAELLALAQTARKGNS